MKPDIHAVVFFTVSALAILAGCSGEDADPQAAAAGKSGAQPGIFQASLADPRRPAEDVQRDAGRKPPM